MIILSHIRKYLIRKLIQLNGIDLAFIVFVYAVISWALLSYAKEETLTNSLHDFVYFLIVTASTVGYGDMSPQTVLGKWIAILFVIPGGIGLFALVIGRIASSMVLVWKRGLLGKRRIKMAGHVLIIGWNPQKTERLINLLRVEGKDPREIVLCVRDEIENPLPGEIKFVRVSSYTDEASMSNASVEQASCIIIDTPEDDFSLSSALFCAGINPQAHILAYFKDESVAELLLKHCPNIECVPSVSTEMLAKAAIDPGSSQLHYQLLDADFGMTQFATEYTGQTATTINTLFTHLKQHHDATLIAIRKNDGIIVNPDVDLVVETGDNLFYIAERRIIDIDWTTITND